MDVAIMNEVKQQKKKLAWSISKCGKPTRLITKWLSRVCDNHIMSELFFNAKSSSTQKHAVEPALQPWVEK